MVAEQPTGMMQTPSTEWGCHEGSLGELEREKGMRGEAYSFRFLFLLMGDASKSEKSEPELELEMVAAAS